MFRCNKVNPLVAGASGCLTRAHCGYSKRAEAARVLPEGVEAKSGRIYYVSFSENCLAASILGWHPNVGHAALVTNDKRGTIKQYDYGWFVGGDGLPPDHWLDLLWGGFPGADAPSVGTVKTVYAKE